MLVYQETTLPVQLHGWSGRTANMAGTVHIVTDQLAVCIMQ